MLDADTDTLLELKQQEIEDIGEENIEEENIEDETKTLTWNYKNRPAHFGIIYIWK